MSSLQSRTPTGLRQGASGDGDGRSRMLEISNSMVRVYKEAFGRGPTKARAYFAGPDILVVLLADSLTVAERNLAAMGEHERLRQSRIFFQHAMEEQFRAHLNRGILALYGLVKSVADLARLCEKAAAS